MRRFLGRINHRHVLPDALLVVVSFYASLLLRANFNDLRTYLPILNRIVFVFLALRLGTLALLGVYDIIWRYISMKDALKLIRAIAFSSVVIVAGTYMIDIGRLPRSVFLIDTLLVTLLLVGVRILRRVLFERPSLRRAEKTGRAVVIYGAGVRGRSLAHRLVGDGTLGFRLVGFIDDDSQKGSRTIGGVKVLGAQPDLAQVLADGAVQELMIAIANLPGEKLRSIIQTAQAQGVRTRLLTHPGTLTGDHRMLDIFRNVDLSDLLNRPKSKVDLSSIRQMIKGRRVLVTGAGGSIGSELSRQIAQFGPGKLLLLDHSEFNLYQIDQELRVAQGAQNVFPLLVDIKDQSSLRAAMREHAPEIVFHAAAYKHVHLVENNPLPSILNNIKGTQNLVELSKEGKVDAFILISTDKAVNPVGIMGATKRVCELMVADAGEQTGKQFCAVRFGNVLGSSGSLIPMLQEQIQNGEPLTITHPDMMRFFMLIPEAVSLVLKAATICKPGDITILKMGEPVRIVDIAKSLIALAGKTEKEVPIVFTGLRPGEKMFEELYLCGNELNSEHPDILLLPKGDTQGGYRTGGGALLAQKIERILSAASEGSNEAILELKSLVQLSSQGAPITARDPERIVALRPQPE